jgi:hypothetical protein
MRRIRKAEPEFKHSDRTLNGGKIPQGRLNFRLVQIRVFGSLIYPACPILP